MTKTTSRKLQDTSWLAQTLTDKMEIELSNNGKSSKWNTLRTFRFIVRSADTGEWGMVYNNDARTNARQIIVPSIPSGMQSDFMGLAEKYTDENGNYIVSVLTTHNLNSAVVKSISDLMDSINLS